MIFNPRNYQQLIIDYAKTNAKAGWFVDMGLGKTASALSLINWAMFEDFNISTVLIVAPLRVADVVWTDEVEKWSNFKHLRISKILGKPKERIKAMRADADIYIVNRENYVWLCQQYGGVLPYDMQIFDESSSFRNHKSRRWQAAKKATVNCKRVLLLTGTPAPQSLQNLWAQIYLLDRGERLGTHITHFRRAHYYCPPSYGNYTTYELVPGHDTKIADKIRDICISLKTEDCIELPARNFNYIKVKYSPEVQDMYTEFEKEQVLALGDEEITVMTAAGLRTKLLQFSNGAIYKDDTRTEWLEVHKEKIDALLELIDTCDGNILLAYYFRHDLPRLLDALADYKPEVLKSADSIKRWQQGKIKIGLIQPGGDAHGLNLQDGGHTTIWFGITHDLEMVEQLNKRLHRSGQKHPVTIHYLIGAGTYDEQVIKNNGDKAEQQRNLINSVNALRKKYMARNLK